MNEGQQKFYDFIMQGVKPGCEADLKEILNESFKRQDEGTFTMEYMSEIFPKVIALLKPESVEEFMKAAEMMKSQL